MNFLAVGSLFKLKVLIFKTKLFQFLEHKLNLTHIGLQFFSEMISEKNFLCVFHHYHMEN